MVNDTCPNCHDSGELFYCEECMEELCTDCWSEEGHDHLELKEED